jgi:hypothetical protein
MIHFPQFSGAFELEANGAIPRKKLVEVRQFLSSKIGVQNPVFSVNELNKGDRVTLTVEDGTSDTNVGLCFFAPAPTREQSTIRGLFKLISYPGQSGQ